MKNYKLYISIMAMIVMFIACEDESLDPRPDLNDFIGAYTVVTAPDDANDLFFNGNNDLSTEQISFTLDYDDFGVTDVTSIDIALDFTELGGKFDPFRGEFVDTTYNQVIIGNIATSDLPATVVYTVPQMLTVLEDLNPKFTAIDSIEIGDAFQLTFPMNLSDGTVLTVALNSDLCNEPAQPSAGGCGFAWTLACESDLSGMIDWEMTASDWGGTGTTGTIEMTETAANGVYAMGSYTFGAYQSVYGCCEQEAASALKIFDVCQSLSLSPADGYGCPWAMSVDAVAGPVLTLSLASGCGPVSHTVELTRQDGVDWAVVL